MKYSSSNMRCFILIFLITVSSCNESAISKKLSAADKLEIRFTVSGSDVIEKSVATEDKNAISKMVQFLDNSPTEQYKCGYDGQLIFFKSGEQLQIIDFKKDDKDCRHFSFLLDEKLMSIKMSNEAADFLNALKEGKKEY